MPVAEMLEQARGRRVCFKLMRKTNFLPSVSSPPDSRWEAYEGNDEPKTQGLELACKQSTQPGVGTHSANLHTQEAKKRWITSLKPA